MDNDCAPAVEGMMLDYGLNGVITDKDGAVLDSEAVLKGSKGRVPVIAFWCQRGL
jgi:hypothetical protein